MALNKSSDNKLLKVVQGGVKMIKHLSLTPWHSVTTPLLGCMALPWPLASCLWNHYKSLVCHGSWFKHAPFTSSVLPGTILPAASSAPWCWSWFLVPSSLFAFKSCLLLGRVGWGQECKFHSFCSFICLALKVQKELETRNLVKHCLGAPGSWPLNSTEQTGNNNKLTTVLVTKVIIFWCTVEWR